MRLLYRRNANTHVRRQNCGWIDWYYMDHNRLTKPESSERCQSLLLTLCNLVSICAGLIYFTIGRWSCSVPLPIPPGGKLLRGAIQQPREPQLEQRSTGLASACAYFSYSLSAPTGRQSTTMSLGVKAFAVCMSPSLSFVEAPVP